LRDDAGVFDTKPLALSLKTSTIAHPVHRCPIRVEIRPHVGAALAAGLADKLAPINWRVPQPASV
jgi:hypothetical protein